MRASAHRCALLAGIACLTAALVVSGCVSSRLGELEQPFADYYPLMSDRQRADFGSLRTMAEREDYIHEQGLDIALALETKLRRGMSPEQVSEILGAPWNSEAHHTPLGAEAGDHLVWFYESRDKVSSPIIYATRFRDQSLVGWDVWRDQ